MTRTCVVRRRRVSALQLVRLCVRDGVLHLSGPGDAAGRGVWVTPDRRSVARVQAHPQMTWRTLRVRDVAAGPILDEVLADTRARVGAAVVRCWRSGLLRCASAGSEQVDGDRLLVPQDVEQNAIVGVVVHTLPFSRAQFEVWTGSPCPDRLVLRQGAPTRRLDAMLRRLEGLG